MCDYSIDLGEQGVSSVPALTAKIVGGHHQLDSEQFALSKLKQYTNVISLYHLWLTNIAFNNMT